MPNIPLYLEKQDVADLAQSLVAAFDIAFIVDVPELAEKCRKHEKYWRATRSLGEIEDRTYAIWVIESGFPLMPNPRPRGPDYLEIEDPFSGWCAFPYTNDETTPRMGDSSRTMLLHVETVPVRYPDLLGLSAISWIGSRYEKPHESTKKLWRRLQSLVKKRSRLVLGDGLISGADSRFPAFPHAYDRIAATWPGRVVV